MLYISLVFFAAWCIAANLLVLGLLLSALEEEYVQEFFETPAGNLMLLAFGMGIFAYGIGGAFRLASLWWEVPDLSVLISFSVALQFLLGVTMVAHWAHFRSNR